MSTHEIKLHGPVGHYPGVAGATSSKAFIEEARKRPKGAEIHLRVDSIGGDVWHGLAIHNWLRSSPARPQRTVAHLDGLAVGAALIVAFAAGTIDASEDSLLYLHPPLGVAFGNSAKLREHAVLLDRIGGGLEQLYLRARPRLSRASLAELLKDGGRWLDPHEAKRLGLVDSVKASTNSAKNTLAGALARLPADLRASLEKAQRTPSATRIYAQYRAPTA
ncbi:MAG: Clp protease ClpP [Deferrisomatales bacterium]